MLSRRRNEFKSLPCQVRNAMETTLYVNDYRLRKLRNNKIDWRIDSCNSRKSLAVEFPSAVLILRLN